MIPDRGDRQPVASLVERAEELFSELDDLPLAAKVEIMNEIKRRLHAHSPFTEPVDCVIWVPVDDVRPNEWNPNTVAPPEMRLLGHSVLEDGFTMPCVVGDMGDKFPEPYMVIDGFHRREVGKNVTKIRKRTHGYLPVSVGHWTPGDLKEMRAATVRHNRARGKHSVLGMTNIVVELVQMGWTDEQIGKHLGMDADEVLRLKQVSGIAELFRNREYSRSWTQEGDIK